VPFAQPPVGDLRWKEPLPAKPWHGTLACTKFGPSPYQKKPVPFMMWTQEFIAPADPLSEDCLYLNIWTPAKSAEEKLPVLVWIYGGGFVSGSAACPIYDGEALAKEGILYVSINYRVGVFGFLSHPELSTESRQGNSGNYGLMDQLAALRWVKKNIAAFGGDPKRVTIAGQSAGSMSVQSLVASPLGKGLFQGAIAQSGGLTGRSLLSLSAAESVGLGLAKNLKGIKGLRALTADSILALSNVLPFGTFAPIIDGYVLPADGKSIFAAGEHSDIPVMTGWVTGDADLVMRNPQTAAQFTSYAKSTFGHNGNDFLKFFPSETDEISKVSQRKFSLLQFAGFPSHHWASSIKSNSYLYEFAYVPTDKPGFPNYGAFHTAEVPFALHTLRLWDRPWKQTDLDVEKYMSQYWVNFVKKGDPNGEGLPLWKNYDKAEGNIMQFGSKPELKPGLFQDEFTVLARIVR
jgi:para-nitrobenzyl esterase